MNIKRFFPIVILLCAATSVWAQTQGRVSGRVLDASGNPIEKAEISIVSQRSSSVHYEIKTGKDGGFVQIGLTPGYYMISCTKAGFAPISREIRIQIDEETLFEARLKPLNAVAQKTLSDADKLFLKGNKLMGENNFAEAAAAYQEALKMDAGSWRYHLNLGLAQKKLNKSDEALAEFTKAVEIDPGNYDANKETGEALAKAGRFADAKPYYEKAAGLRPDDADAQFNLGVCLIDMGDSEAGLEQFRRTTALKSDYADAYYQMGTILISQNKLPEAVQCLEKFLFLAPNHEKAGVARQLLQYIKK